MGEKKLYEITFCKSDGGNRIFFEIFPNLPYKRWTRLYILKKKKKKKTDFFFFFKQTNQTGVLIHAQRNQSTDIELW